MTGARIDLVDPSDLRARACLQAYFDELAELFPEGFDPARSRQPDDDALRLPRGAFLLATLEEEPAGCLALKGAVGFGEVKRVWVSPGARGMGLARGLLERAAEEARGLGYGLLRLDTHRTLVGAAAMYRALGWREIERFNDDPYAHLFFEKAL